jgi:two-component system, OmpR family, phosphate regulon sensor histidine kinase PhoR
VSFVSWVHAAPDWVRDLIVAALLLLTIPVGWASISLSPPGTGLATWWPAASLSVVAATMARGKRIGVVLAIVAVTFIANIAAGREIVPSIGFGFANAAESWVIATIATRGGRTVSIDRVSDATRLFLAVLAGGLTIGIAVAVVMFTQGQDPIDAAISAAASHGSAVLLLAPLAILPSATFGTQRARELAIQALTLTLVVFVVFAPSQFLPLTFLIFPLFVWGSFRFGTGIMALESLAVAAVLTGSLFWSGGPFAAVLRDSPSVAIHLVQLYAVVLAVTSLVLGRARAERLRIGALGRAREVVLRSGITGSPVGFVIVESDSSAQLRLAAANDVADELLHVGDVEWVAGEPVHVDQFTPELIEPLHELISGRTSSWNGRISAGDDERIIDAHLTRVRSAFGTLVLTVQVEDVTKREQARLANERALENERATVDKLREANQQKDDFVSAVSHELRTPLTSIVGFADELNQLELPAEAMTYLEVINRNAVRLGELVEDLLEVGRLNSQTQLKARERVDVDSLIESVISDLHHSAAARKVTVERTGAVGASLVSVRTDLTRILVNLLSNAIKFSPVGETVEIAVDLSAIHLQVRVRDHGVGISAHDLDRVFDRFYRTTSAATVPGSGLGLAIARGLAESLGGTVRLRSEVGEGTTALLTLPIAPARPRRQSED